MISKGCGYAIRGVIYLALNENINRKISVHELATHLKIPQPFMGKILQELVRKGLINSTKGPNGGFYVDESVLELPLIKIVEAIDGLNILKKCLLGCNECTHVKPCPMHVSYEEYRTGIFESFENNTISNLIKSLREGVTFLSN